MRGGAAEEGGKRETEKRIGTRKYNGNYRKGGKSEINSTIERGSEMNIEYDNKYFSFYRCIYRKDPSN